MDMHLKSWKCSLSVVCAVFICVFIFSKLNHAVCVDENEEDQTCDAYTVRTASNVEQSSNMVFDGTDTSKNTDEINVIITFTNAKNNPNLQSKFGTTVGSLFQHSSVRIALFIIGEQESQEIAKKILENNVDDSTKYRLAELDVDDLAKKVEVIIRPMQQHFSYKPGAYYNHALFFLSMVLHRVLPVNIHRVIMLDADLKFNGDIGLLYDHFRLFGSTNVIGLANEAQPVYRHTYYQYRHLHPGTLVGEPPPNGLPGFNSGVVLLDLDRMRNSTLYNSMLVAESVHNLCEQFHFKGHLGDQDFFTLVGMLHKQLFYVLPCQWNRQLCQWWRNHGYEDVFDNYFKCDGKIMIHHGNCNTPIP